MKTEFMKQAPKYLEYEHATARFLWKRRSWFGRLIFLPLFLLGFMGETITNFILLVINFFRWLDYKTRKYD